jgi:hypothetical protein
MAPTRKSAKRASGKKRTAKRATAKKRPRAKPASRRRGKSAAKKASSSKKRSRARAARGPLDSVIVAGEKTWEVLKSTTAQMVEGVKGTFGTEENSNGR